MLDRAAVINKLIYAATNPVKDLLVQHAHQWPGTKGYRALTSSRPLQAWRPRHFFRDKGTMPATVTLTLQIPEELGSGPSIIAAVRAGVDAVERKVFGKRAETGARVLGVRQVLAQSWSGSPTSPAPRRTLRPRFAGGADVRVPALVAYKEFQASYAYARRQWVLRQPATFPAGTYGLALFAPITLSEVVTPV